MGIGRGRVMAGSLRNRKGESCPLLLPNWAAWRRRAARPPATYKWSRGRSASLPTTPTTLDAFRPSPWKCVRFPNVIPWLQSIQLLKPADTTRLQLGWTGLRLDVCVNTSRCPSHIANRVPAPPVPGRLERDNTSGTRTRAPASTNTSASTSAAPNTPATSIRGPSHDPATGTRSAQSLPL